MRTKFREDNRGAALVSIMIAVAFITILATSMLYMSFNNYQMKVVNYQSKSNFYETEQSVTQMTSGFRNDVMTSGAPLTAIRTAAGVDSSDRYNVKKLAEFAFPGATVSGDANSASVSSEGDTFTFATNVTSGANYVVTEQPNNIKQITLKGITVTQREPDTLNTNTITTDLVMYIKSSDAPSAMGGVGEFSLMMDSSVNCNASGDAVKLNVFGNGFFMGVDFGTESMPGTKANGHAAINLGGNCTYNILGDYNLVYGDVVLSGDSSLNIIGGSLTVYGNIYIEEGCTLTCNGLLYMPPNDIIDPQTGNPYGIICTGAVDKHVYPADLSSNIVRLDKQKCDDIRKDLKLNDGDQNNDGLVYQIITKQAPITGGAEQYFDEEALLPMSTSFTTDTVNIGGVNMRTKFFSNSICNPGDINDGLIFLGEVMEMRGTNDNATIISRTPVSFSQVHELNLTKMGTHAFDYMTMKSTDSDDNFAIGYDTGVHQIKLKNNKVYEVGGFISDTANTFVKTVMGNAVNGGGEVTYTSAIGYQNWQKE